MTDPHFYPGLRRKLSEAYPRTSAAMEFPDWTAKAACRKPVPDGRVRGIFFTDDMSSTEGIDKAKRAMAICVGCPVRLDCIAYAYAEEALDTEDDEIIAKPRRYGVFGGLPGRQRERFAHKPNRIALGEAWLAGIAEQERWTITTREEQTA